MIAYHIATARRIWESIDRITEEQFLMSDEYSRGPVRNLMVHLASTDWRWLSVLRAEPDVGDLEAEQYSTRTVARALSEQVQQDLVGYLAGLNEADLEADLSSALAPRWVILLQLVNHGTDHRATLLQRLQGYGAPTFDQDFML